MENRLIEKLAKRDWRPLVVNTHSRKLKENKEMVSPDTFIGIEVEAENFQGLIYTEKNKFIQNIWGVDSDGSLRNNGVEFISVPLQTKYTGSALQTLFSMQGGKLDFSKRTSIHIHMNVRDMTYEQLMNLILIYCCFEDALFTFAGEWRKKTIFCVPLTETNMLLNPSMLEAPGYIMSGGKWLKYSALNLLPVHLQGTVEFRHLQGTQNVNYITTWINLLCCLRQYACSTSFDELSKEVFTLISSSKYFEFAQKVFKDLLPDLLPSGNFNIPRMDSVIKFVKTNLITTESSSKSRDLYKFFGIEEPKYEETYNFAYILGKNMMGQRVPKGYEIFVHGFSKGRTSGVDTFATYFDIFSNDAIFLKGVD